MHYHISRILICNKAVNTRLTVFCTYKRNDEKAKSILLYRDAMLWKCNTAEIRNKEFTDFRLHKKITVDCLF